MNWFAILTIFFTILTVYFTYTEFRKDKATKKKFRAILISGSVVVICMVFVLGISYSL
jgi:uncharacterized membrane protein